MNLLFDTIAQATTTPFSLLPRDTEISDNVDNHSIGTLIVASVVPITIISTIFAFARLFVKGIIQRRLQYDDGILLASVVWIHKHLRSAFMAAFNIYLVLLDIWLDSDRDNPEGGRTWQRQACSSAHRSTEGRNASLDRYGFCFRHRSPGLAEARCRGPNQSSPQSEPPSSLLSMGVGDRMCYGIAWKCHWALCAMSAGRCDRPDVHKDGMPWPGKSGCLFYINEWYAMDEESTTGTINY